MKYIDAHCHLQFDAYDTDRAEIISEMERQGIAGIVVGVDFVSSQKAVALAEKYPHLFATVGVHPCYVANEPFNEEGFRDLARHPKVVGVGECGLDYFRVEDSAELLLQEEVFKKQIELALSMDLPLMIHARVSSGTQDAYQRAVEILMPYQSEWKQMRGNFHFFTGDNTSREAITSLGFSVSVTGVITFTGDYDEMVRNAKRDCLLGETDAPLVAPKPFRGERNSPLLVPLVYERIADIWGEDREKVRVQLVENARSMFGI